MKVINIGPCTIKDCMIGVNAAYEDKSARVKSVKYIMVSPNFVHPEQSYLMAVVTCKPKRFGLF